MFSALPLSAKPHAPDQASSPSRSNPLLDRAAAGAAEGSFAALMKRESLTRDLAGARSRLESAPPPPSKTNTPAARQSDQATPPRANSRPPVAAPSEQARPLNEVSSPTNTDSGNNGESAGATSSTGQASSSASKPTADQTAEAADAAESETGVHGPETKAAAEPGHSPGEAPTKAGRKPGHAAHGQAPGLAGAGASRHDRSMPRDDALSGLDADLALQDASALAATAQADGSGADPNLAWPPAQALAPTPDLAQHSGSSSLAAAQAMAMAAQGSDATALAAQSSANGGQRGPGGMGTAAPAGGVIRTGSSDAGHRAGQLAERHERGLPQSDEAGLAALNQAVVATGSVLATASASTKAEPMAAGGGVDNSASGQHDLGSAALALPMQGLSLENQSKAAAEALAPREATVGALPTAAPSLAQAPAAATATAGQRQVAEVRLPLPLHDPGFGSALGAQISLLARGGLHEARLQLNPAEMGPITVQIALDGAAARVHFQADLAATREVIEASLPALAGALRESGLTLAGGGVSQQHQQQSGRQPGSENAGPATGQSQAGLGDEGSALASSRPLANARGLVDLIA